MLYDIQIVIENNFGKFKGPKLLVDDDSYNELKKKVSGFYKESGFELTLEDGTFIIFPPEIVKSSILSIECKVRKE